MPVFSAESAKIAENTESSYLVFREFRHCWRILPKYLKSWDLAFSVFSALPENLKTSEMAIEIENTKSPRAGRSIEMAVNIKKTKRRQICRNGLKYRKYR